MISSLPIPQWACHYLTGIRNHLVFACVWTWEIWVEGRDPPALSHAHYTCLVHFCPQCCQPVAITLRSTPHSGSLQSIETLDERAGEQRHHLWPPLPILEPPEPLTTLEAAAAAEAVAEAEVHPWELLPPPQRLAEVVQYLRARHAYCLFCGCQYRGAEDMAANCPGATEDEH